MTRDEFKSTLNDLIDDLVKTDRELTDEDETKLVENLGDTASEIIASDGVDEEDDDAKDDSVEG